MTSSTPLQAALRARRQRFATALAGTRCAIAAGLPRPRNYPDNTYPFRASSHFLYLMGPTGAELPGAVLTFDTDGSPRLFTPEPDAADALWHGPRPDAGSLADLLQLAVEPLTAWPAFWAAGSYGGPPAPARPGETCPELDLQVAQALVTTRLVHDAEAQAGLRRAAEATVAAHLAGMACTPNAEREWHVCAAMEHALARRGCTTAYGSIVTTRGEVLHNHSHGGKLTPGGLLLADVGAETPDGWAGDVTRTWPVSGRFSEGQRAVYEVVWRAQQAAIKAVGPGRRFRDVHLCAARTMAEGLVDLGVLQGPAEARVEDGSYALFMPHGIGHLLGLDVHDMEDLGDRAGYAPGRTRDSQFGLSYLRLDRDLQAGMAVTIEPGFYRVPALLAAPERVGLSAKYVNRERLDKLADVRGIRIEDDVLVTTDGCEVLTRALPSTADEVQALVSQSAPPH